MPARRTKAALRRHRRTRAQRHARAGRPSPKRSSAPTRAVAMIDWPDGFCRRDIGWRAIARETARHERDLPDLFPGFAERRIKTAASRSSPASAALARRCSCCTAIRRRTSAGTDGARPRPALHAGHCRICAATAQAGARRRRRALDLFQACDGRRLPGRHARARPRAVHGCGPRSRRPRRLPPRARSSAAVTRARAARHRADLADAWRRMRTPDGHGKPSIGRSWRSRRPFPETLIGRQPMFFLEHMLAQLDRRATSRPLRPRRWSTIARCLPAIPRASMPSARTIAPAPPSMSRSTRRIAPAAARSPARPLRFGDRSARTRFSPGRWMSGANGAPTWSARASSRDTSSRRKSPPRC